LKEGFKLTCSTGCLNPKIYGVNLDSIVQTMAQVETDSIEVMIFRAWMENLGHVADCFRGLRKSIVSVHGVKAVGTMIGSAEDTERESGLRILRKNIDFAHSLGAKNLTIHAWDPLEAKLNLNKNVKALEQVLDYASRKSVTLSLEIVPSASQEPHRIAEFLHETLDSRFRFTVDLEFAAQYDSVEKLLSFTQRVNNLHIRDYDGKWQTEDGERRYCKLGKGKINFTNIFKKLIEQNYQGLYTLESPCDNAREINQSLKLLQNLLEHASQEAK